MTDFAPDYPNAIVHPSPNHGERRGGRAADCILLHYTGMPTGQGALARLCDCAAEVSSHYLVFEDGRVLQLVPEGRRAWHAGTGRWKDDADINSCSIGVEIVNPGHDGALPPYPQAQIEAVAALCRDIAARHAIAPERILAHSDIAPGRKRDPGEHFPWETLHARGVGHWVPARQQACDVNAPHTSRGYYDRPVGEHGGGNADVMRRLQPHWAYFRSLRDHPKRYANANILLTFNHDLGGVYLYSDTGYGV